MSLITKIFGLLEGLGVVTMIVFAVLKLVGVAGFDWFLVMLPFMIAVGLGMIYSVYLVVKGYSGRYILGVPMGLTVIFLILKLCDVIGWAWGFVFLPMLIFALLFNSGI